MIDEGKDSGPVFKLKSSDATASLTVDFWELLQLKVRSFIEIGLSIDAAVRAARSYYDIPQYHPGLEDAKLDGASTIARAMDAWTGHKKIAD